MKDCFRSIVRLIRANEMYRFLSHWIQSLHIMFYSLSEKINTINLLLKNNNDNKYCKWGHFVVSPDFNSVQ